MEMHFTGRTVESDHAKVSVAENLTKRSTGGPPLTQKSLTRFPLTRFLAYVRVSVGISVSRGPQYSRTNMSFMSHGFFQVPKCA